MQCGADFPLGSRRHPEPYAAPMHCGADRQLGLRVFDENKDIMVQVFGSARNNEAIRACLQTYLDDEADQLSRLVEEGKKTGLFDPAVSTTAIRLLCQSLCLGSHLLLTAGLSERHIPGEDEWIDLLWKLLTAVTPPPPPPH